MNPQTDEDKARKMRKWSLLFTMRNFMDGFGVSTSDSDEDLAIVYDLWMERQRVRIQADTTTTKHAEVEGA